MPFQEIVAPSIRELFVQQLTGLILSGELRPGDRLPTERELADEMKISKTVVHEGIRELRRQGFLDVSSRRGVTVADYAQTGSLETLMAIMDYHGGFPTARRPAASSSCATISRPRRWSTSPRITRRRISPRCARCSSRRRRHPCAGEEEFAEALLRYHRGITFLSGNTITPLIFNAFRKVNLEFWRGVYPRRGHGALSRDARRFTDYIERGEGRAAAELLREGLAQFRESI